MNVRVRAFVVMVLIAGSMGGLFVANMVIGSRVTAAQASTFETSRRVVRFYGRALIRRRARTVVFSVPVIARVDASLRWRNPLSSLSERLSRDGRTIDAEQVTTGRRYQVRTYKDVAAGTYAVHVRARHRGSHFVLVVTETWTVEVKPKSSPTPTGPVGSTATPTPSASTGSVGPSVDPSPSSAPPPTGTSKVAIFSVGTSSANIGAVLADPYVSGISQRFSWASIEPESGQYRWTAIDNAIAQARAAGKQAMIRVIAGMYTPAWVDQQVKTLTFSNTYLYNPAAYPSQVTMPVPWDPTYLSLWERFVTAFGQRYDGNPTIYSVQMAGGGFIGEMTLPTDVDAWLAAGYTDAKYISAWEDIIGAYRASFPHTHTNLDITEPFGGLLTTNVVKPVVSFATSVGAQNAFIQSNALRASMLGTMGPYRTEIRSVSSVTSVGYQMIGDASTSTSLTQAFTVAIQDQASYVEVYASDVLDPANQDALRYLASGGTS